MSILNEIDAQINSILSLVKRMPKCINRNSSPNLIFYGNNKNSMSLLTTTSRNNNQQKSFSYDWITKENFPFTHVCNRDVDLIIFSSIQ